MTADLLDTPWARRIQARFAEANHMMHAPIGELTPEQRCRRFQMHADAQLERFDQEVRRTIRKARKPIIAERLKNLAASMARYCRRCGTQFRGYTPFGQPKQFPDTNRIEYCSAECATAVQREQRAVDRVKRGGAPTIPFTADQLEARLSMFAGRCWLCGKAGADSIDHVKPVSAGGWNCLSNLPPAHRWCNMSKGSRWPVNTSLLAASTRDVELSSMLADRHTA